MKCLKCGSGRLDLYCSAEQYKRTCAEVVVSVIANLHTLEYLSPFLASDIYSIREAAKQKVDSVQNRLGIPNNRDRFTQWLYNQYKTMDIEYLKEIQDASARERKGGKDETSS